jgi:hypothetical protein
MSKVYIIKDENHTLGSILNETELAPFIVFNDIIKYKCGDWYCLCDHLNLDPDYATKEEVCAELENLAISTQKLIFERFCIYVNELDIWSYEEYRHNKLWEES